VVPLKTLGEAIETVILPDFQGMGIGVRFTEIVAQIHLDEVIGFHRTAHPN
jgi:hypothetical protein